MVALNTRTIVQRACAACEEEEDAKQLQTKRHEGIDSSAGKEAPPSVHQVIGTSGNPLDSAARDFFEPRFGYDFSQVRIHDDARAAKSAQQVGARAYTVGGHVVLDPAHGTPAGREGKRLLAHELAHVVQQSGAQPHLLQRDDKKAGKAGGKAKAAPTAADAPKLDLTMSKNGDPCACLVVVHNDEENARKTAQLMQENCAYNLALVVPGSGREIKIPGTRGTVDPNSLFPQDIAEMCLSDEKSCRDFLTSKSGTTDKDEIQKFVRIQFFLAISDCSKNFSLPVVGLHNNDIEDTKKYLKAKDKAGVEDLKLDIDKGKKETGEDQVKKLKDLINKKFGPDVEKDIVNTAGKTNIFRWCASKDLSKCHIGDPDHPDNVTWVTNPKDFDTLSTKPINVALQTDLPAKGSESEGDLSTLFLILRNIFHDSLTRLVAELEAQAQADWAAVDHLIDEMEKLSKFGDLTPEERLKDEIDILLKLIDLLLTLLVLAGAPLGEARINALRYVNIETPGKRIGDQTDAERLRNYESISNVLKALGLHCCGKDTAKAEENIKKGLTLGDGK